MCGLSGRSGKIANLRTAVAGFKKAPGHQTRASVIELPKDPFGEIQ